MVSSVDINQIYKWVFYAAIAVQVVLSILIPYQQQSASVLNDYKESTQFPVIVMNDSGITPSVVNDKLVFASKLEEQAFNSYLEQIVQEVKQTYPDCEIVEYKYSAEQNTIVFILKKGA